MPQSYPPISWARLAEFVSQHPKFNIAKEDWADNWVNRTKNGKTEKKLKAKERWSPTNT